MAAGFEELYGQPPSVAADAPGRVNLIGEHTDPNRGYLMPLAPPPPTGVELPAPRGLDGHAVSGWEGRSESAVARGAGLSSSAALAVALLRALRAGFGLRLDDMEIAGVVQRSENLFVGAPVGIMDPMAASLADEHRVLFLDTRSLAFERLALPPAAELLGIDSGISHPHAGA